MYIMHPVPYCRTDINLRQLSFLKMFLVLKYMHVPLLIHISFRGLNQPSSTNEASTDRVQCSVR